MSNVLTQGTQPVVLIVRMTMDTLVLVGSYGYPSAPNGEFLEFPLTTPMEATIVKLTKTDRGYLQFKEIFISGTKV